MTYEQVKSLKPEDFKRLCGVRPDTNNCDGRGSAMSTTGCAYAQPAKTKNRKTRQIQLGGPIVDDIRILERSRRRSASGENRTYFHIGQSWGVNESTVYRIIRKIEDTLIKSKVFTLPGKKKLVIPIL